MPETRRAPRSLPALVACLLVALACLAVPVLTAGPAGADVDRPGPGADFPVLPSSCQSVYKPLPLKPCHLTSFGQRRPTVVVWGDSHTLMYQYPLVRVARHKRVNLVFVSAGGCPPAIPRPHVAGQYYTQCEARDVLVLDYVEKLTHEKRDFTLLVGANWAGYRAGYRRIQTGAPGPAYSKYAAHLIKLEHYGTEPLFERLGALGVRVDVIGQAATVPLHPGRCAGGTDPYQCDLPRVKALNHEDDNRRFLQRMLKHVPGPARRPSRIVDATPGYCDPSTCFAHVDGVNTFFDSLHIGARASRKLSRYFVPVFEDALER